MPLACQAFTFEMGGVLDVDPKQATRYARGFQLSRQDAERLVNFDLANVESVVMAAL